MRIIIVGGCKEGKSIMAALIAKTLAANGIEIDGIKDDTARASFARKMSLDFSKIFKTLRERGKKITIETFQTARSRKEESYFLK